MLFAATALAETWPPLRPPDPMPVEWVVKQMFIRYPEVHAKHRAWLAALERVPEKTKDDPRAQLLEHDADLARLHAIEHHLDLESQARQVFYDYLLAGESIALIENQKRMWEQYQVAMRARLPKGAAPPPRDLALEAARLHIRLLKFYQDRDSASARLTALLDRSLQGPPFPPAKLGELTPLPPDRKALLIKAVDQSERMQRARTQIKRAAAVMELAQKKGAPGDLAAATHEVARRQDEIRALSLETIRAVTTQHDLARSRQDAMQLYDQEILPRVEQSRTAALAAYQSGTDDITRVLDAHAAQIDAELERLQARVDYEKALAELTRAVGVLAPELEKKMARKPLNVGGKK